LEAFKIVLTLRIGDKKFTTVTYITTVFQLFSFA